MQHKLLKLDFEQTAYFFSHLIQFVTPNQTVTTAEDNMILGSDLLLLLTEEIEDKSFFETIQQMKVTAAMIEKAKQAFQK